MDQKKLDQQSQHWEINFSNKPEMFGLAPSLSAEKALKIFKKRKINKIIELGAGLGRDSILFANKIESLPSPAPSSIILLIFLFLKIFKAFSADKLGARPNISGLFEKLISQC